MTEVRDFSNENAAQTKQSVSDVKISGNVDMFQLICKASSKEQGWMKSTKALEIENVGCMIQVTTQNKDNVAEACVFVPGIKIGVDSSGNKCFVKF